MMMFYQLAGYLEKLEETDSRLEITEILAQILKEAEEKEVASLCYLILGELAPSYRDINFNLADKMMVKILARAFGVEEKIVREEYKKEGDLGTVGERLKKKAMTPRLFNDLPLVKGSNKMASILAKGKKASVLDIYHYLKTVASVSGEGSQEAKITMMAALLRVMDGRSDRFLIRVPLGRLRLGFSEITLLDALSWYIAGDKNHRAVIEEAYNVYTDIGYIAEMVVSRGLKGLTKVLVSLGTPVNLALCQRLPNMEKIVEKMINEENDLVAVEPKYDGTRLEAHYQAGGKKKIWLFTRGLENVVHMFPDIAAAIERELSVKSVILDGEIIGYDEKTGALLPFQETIKRKRKYLIKEAIGRTPLRYYCFDILYLNGKSLLKKPFKYRRQLLEKIISAGKNKKVLLSPQILTNDARELKKYHHQQIEAGLEGVVVKKWRANYDVGKRGYTWVKLKQAKNKTGGGLADTIDGVVMGYYRGRGRRAPFGIGAFLLGIKKQDNSEEIVTLSKIGTGLTDEQWRQMRLVCDKNRISDCHKRYKLDKNLAPDVWCQPAVVVEIEADNVSSSPIHSAGLALRFPRLIRFRRDKMVNEITTVAEIKKLKKMQESKGS